MPSQYPTALDTTTTLSTAVNGLQTTLTGDHTSGATTITVGSTAGAASAGYVWLDAEVIKYAGVTPTTLTGCTRGADNTAAAQHNNGTTVKFGLVADHHNALVSGLIAAQTKLGLNTNGASASSIDAGQLAAGSSATLTALTTTGIVTGAGLRDSRGVSGGNVPFIWLKVNGDGTTNKVSFPTIPAGFSIARLSWDARTTSATNGEDAIGLQFNTDTGTAYFGERVSANTATATVVDGGILAASLTVGFVSGGGTSANFYGHGFTEIANYANTTNIKGAVGISQIPKVTGATGSWIEFMGGNWTSTAAINRIDVICGAGFWTTNSIFILQLA